MTSARTKVKPPISTSYTVSATGGFAVTVRGNEVASAWPVNYFVLYRDDEEIATSLSTPLYRDVNVTEGAEYVYQFATVNVHEVEGAPGIGTSVVVPAFPVWSTGWGLSLDQNTSQSVTNQVTDPLGLSLTYSRNGGTAPGATTVSSAGVVAVAASTPGSYTLGIQASNGQLASTVSISMVVNAVITAPSPPENYSAAAVSDSQTDHIWSAPSSGPPPTAYELNRSLTGTGGWSANLLSSGTATSFSDTGLSASTQYFYRLRAENSGLFSSYVTDNSTTEAATSSQADFVIQAGTTSWDGSVSRVPLTGGAARAVQAGDIIELEAGTYQRLTLLKISPAANTITDPNTDYVTVRGPATGRATITASSGTASILQINGCRFVKVDAESQTTTPDVDGKRRNIRVTCTGSASPTFLIKYGSSGSGYSQTRDIVLKHIDVAGNWPGTGEAGSRIGIGSNGAFTAAEFPSAWQENMIFEHLYVHDVKSEGIYCGSNPYKTVRPTPPPGRDVPVRYAKIRYCRFEDIGGSGVNNKSWFGGVNGADQFPTAYDNDTNNSVHDCDFFRCGIDGSASANPPNSPAISSRSCKEDIYNIRVENCGGWAVSYAIDEGTNVDFPAGVSTNFSCRLYNAVLVGNGTQTARGGVKSDAVGMPEAFKPHLKVFSCTILSNNDDGIQFGSTVASDCSARNNIVLGNAASQINWGPITNENSKNLVTGSVSTAIFNDVTGTIEAGTADFGLSAAQPVASGSVLGVDVSTADIEGSARVLASADKGAYEF